MAFIQSQYNTHQQLGLPGQIFHSAEAYAFDQGVAGVELRPGDGAYYDAATDKFIKPVDAPTALLVTHVVGFDSTSFNSDIAAPTANSTSEVVFPVGSVIKALAYGTMIVTAGSDVNTFEDLAVFDQATGRWNKYTQTPGTIADFRAAVFVFITSGGNGDPVGIRHHGRAQR